MAYGFVLGGLILLALGSEAVLRGGVGLSRLFGLSPLFIGLFIVSAGTSAPELVVTLDATLKGAPGLGLGNIIGSNIVNLLLILGVGAVIRPLPVSPKLVVRDGIAMALAALAFAGLAVGGEITRLAGEVMLAGFLLYSLLVFVTDFRRPPAQSSAEARALARDEFAPGGGASALLLLIGFVCLYLGASVVVAGGVSLGREYGISNALIGLTVVALGTSLPELATIMVASARGHSNVAIGHLIGANIFNILVASGLAAAIHPIDTHGLVDSGDLIVLLAVTVLVPLILASRWQITRGQGIFLVLSYFAYLGYLAWRQGLLPVTLPHGL